MELYNVVCSDPGVLEQPKVLEGGLIELSTALHKAKASDEMLSVVHFMLEHHIKVLGLYYLNCTMLNVPLMLVWKFVETSRKQLSFLAF